MKVGRGTGSESATSLFVETSRALFTVHLCMFTPHAGWLIWKNLLKSTRGHDEDWTVYRTAEKGELPLVEDDLGERACKELHLLDYAKILR